jgi:putative oxidoreductase
MVARLIRRSLATTAPGATILVRLIVGGVFLAEGIQKFLYPEALGAGRFARIGIPLPEIMGPFVGVVEIVCGGLLLLGLLTRLAAIPLVIDISVAIVSTKVPILLGHGYWLFNLPKADRYGFWSMIHEARVDLSMWLGLVFLLIVGAGYLSVDTLLSHRKGAAARSDTAGKLAV